MVLTFSSHQFVDRIKSRIKQTTIRDDESNRWVPGRKIHFWKGNPRNTKSNPYTFGTGVCTSTERVVIDFDKETIYLPNKLKVISDFQELDEFAKTEGFDNWDYLKFWFYERGYLGTINKKLIHFIYHAPQPTNP